MIVKDGFVDVIDRPGIRIDLLPEQARRDLGEDYCAFFE